MEALKTIKNYNSNKFIIKPKASISQIRSENSEIENSVSCTEQQLDMFLHQMSLKSKRFKQLLCEMDVNNEEQFLRNYLFKSVCVKTLLKTVLDKMLNERRLGKNLKGMNKSNMVEIEGVIWSSLSREIEIYKNQKEFTKSKQELQSTLAKRKQQILHELEKLRYKSSRASTSPNQLCQ